MNLNEAEKELEEIRQSNLPVDLTELQSQLIPWTLVNFGERPTWFPLMGAIEEIGETSAAHLNYHHPLEEWDTTNLLFTITAYLGRAAHHHLKSEQKIRGDAAYHRKNLIQSLALLMQAVSELAEIVYPDEGEWNTALQQADVEFSQGDFPEPGSGIRDGVADTMIYLADYCNANGINATYELDKTWRKVRDRNWTQDPGRIILFKDVVVGQAFYISGETWTKMNESEDAYGKWNASREFGSNSVRYRYFHADVAVFRQYTKASA